MIASWFRRRARRPVHRPATPFRPRFEALEDRQLLSTFTVTNVNNAGAGSLRQAILDVNANANSGGLDVIAFNIPGSGPHTISPTSLLPSIADPVMIDGYTEPGTSPNTLAVGTNAALRIRVDGAQASGLVTTGLFLTDTADGSVIQGLSVTGWTTGISVAADNVTLGGNFIGVIPGGFLPAPNNAGVVLLGNNNLVGGTTPDARNLISGNTSEGVRIVGDDNQVQGNLIGTGPTALTAVANDVGVLIEGANNVIGGSAGGSPINAPGNIIAGNSGDAVRITGSDATNNLVQGNYIGLEPVSGTAVANGGTGVVVTQGAQDNVIGRPAVDIFGGPAPGNQIAFSGGFGVLLQTSGNAVSSNTIFSNTLAGIRVPSGSGNLLRSNSVFANGGLGIDLGLVGVTANDAGDADVGANGLQNFPNLDLASTSANSVTIIGSLQSLPNAAYTIQFFAGNAGDGGEGRTLLGSEMVTTDANGNATFFVSFPQALTAGSEVTATAIDADGNTSEFSPLTMAVECPYGTPNECYVYQAYLDILHRPVEAGGLAFWSGQLAQGLPRTQLAAALAASDEYRALVVRQAYLDILNRPVDAPSLGFWVQFLGAGNSVDALRVQLLASDEYFQLKGGTADGFVKGVYLDVLLRSADAGGLTFYTGLVNNGTPRAVVAQMFVASLEADQKRVQGLYREFLRRSADNAGLNGFAGLLQQGGKEEQVLAALVGSDEYFASV